MKQKRVSQCDVCVCVWKVLPVEGQIWREKSTRGNRQKKVQPNRFKCCKGGENGQDGGVDMASKSKSQKGDLWPKKRKKEKKREKKRKKEKKREKKEEE